MFGADHLPNGMTLGRAEAGYLLTDALGPYFRDLMLQDARKAVSFSVCYDETTNAKHRKELQIGFRYWSEKTGEIIFKHLETFFIGIATGEVLKSHILMGD
ncbi:Scarecrow-like protein 28 [Frankliniella fusca]|uniref:Scarecrow-like protein 28 n=1 Tax=Frankliniella fusca TaxID=407009 RepID=A0AAE1GSU6_9NEOP|nr:Scarecrow-like protein 28 [Frankliniella fusca]